MKTNLLLRICKNIIHGIIVKLRQKWKPMIYRYSRERILTVICYESKTKRLIYVGAFLGSSYLKPCRVIDQMYCKYYWYKIVIIYFSFVSILDAHLLHVVPNSQFEWYSRCHGWLALFMILGWFITKNMSIAKG